MDNRVGIFGGSFDPVHIGHIRQCESYLASGFIDQIWIVPVFAAPHKSTGTVASYSDRLEMLNLAFADNERIRVMDIESSLPIPNYTIRTLDFLNPTYPDLHFCLCIGSDSLAQFHTWYEYEQILVNTRLLVATRPDVDISDVKQSILEKSTIINHEPVDISSSQIRQELALTGTSVGLTIPVLRYIKEKNLYI